MTATTTTTTTTTTATKRRVRRGLSLIEVMIAAALLGLGITAILSSFGTYTNLVTHQRHMLDAAFIAQSQLQRLSSLPSTHTDLAAGAHSLTSAVDAANASSTTGPFTVNWLVTNNTPTQHAREIRVVVGFDTNKTFELVGLRP